MDFSGRCAWLISAALLLGTLPAGGQELVTDDPRAGLAAWRRIESVLTHPRCLNCHTMTDYPRQGDDRRVHALEVRRGSDGHGVAPKCQACHTDSNQTAIGIPGVKDWHLAPLTFAWESQPGEAASGQAICATLKQAGDGGEPDYEKLIEYAQLADFVQWAWEPGKRRDGADRATPPISHEAFVEALKRWISAGAPCPGDAPSPEPAPAEAEPLAPAPDIAEPLAPTPPPAEGMAPAPVEAEPPASAPDPAEPLAPIPAPAEGMAPAPAEAEPLASAPDPAEPLAPTPAPAEGTAPAPDPAEPPPPAPAGAEAPNPSP